MQNFVPVDMNEAEYALRKVVSRSAVVSALAVRMPGEVDMLGEFRSTKPSPQPIPRPTLKPIPEPTQLPTPEPSAPPGTVARAETAAEACLACPAGSYAGGAGAKACTRCAQGAYSSAAAQGVTAAAAAGVGVGAVSYTHLRGPRD